jgi:hypothetical protein
MVGVKPNALCEADRAEFVRAFVRHEAFGFGVLGAVLAMGRYWCLRSFFLLAAQILGVPSCIFPFCKSARPDTP